MTLTKKQLSHIKKAYPAKSVQELSRELGLKLSLIYGALGLRAERRALRLEQAMGCGTCMLVLVAPFVFVRDLSNFADLPQRVIIQTGAAGLLLCWALRVLVTGQLRFIKIPLYWFTGGFVLWALASLLWARSWYEAFYAAVHWTACAAVMFIVSSELNRPVWTRMLAASVAVAGTGSLLLGLAQQFLGLDLIPQISRPAAVFANVNMAAHYAAIVLPVVAAFGFSLRRKIAGIASCVAVAAGMVFLFCTHCRAAWAAAACALLWSAVLVLKRRFGSAAVLKSSAAALAAGVILAAVLGLSGMLHQFVAGADGSARYRLTVWRNCLEMVRERPVQGYAAGGFAIFYPGYTYRAAMDRAFDKNKQIRRVHNDFIQTAVELGIVGLILLTLVLMYGLFMGWRLMDRKGDTDRIVLAAGASAGVAAFMVTAFFSFPLQRSMPFFIVSVCLGILACLYSRCRAPGGLCAVRVPRMVAVTVFVIVLAAAGALVRFNARNILCDRYFCTAMGMEKRGANRAALAAGLRAHAYNRSRMDVLSTVGRAYLTTGKLDEAIKALQQVIARHPYNLNAMFILGAAYANADRSREALETFRRVLQIKPDFADARKMIYSIKTHGSIRVNLQ